MYFLMYLPACMASHGHEDLFLELEILHMFLAKDCRDMGEGFYSERRVPRVF